MRHGLCLIIFITMSALAFGQSDAAQDPETVIRTAGT
jgi:hypothetical protein